MSNQHRFVHALPPERLGRKLSSLEHFQELSSARQKQKEYTLIVVTTNDTAILLGRKHRGFGQGMYNSFGGKIEAGETPAAGAVRELYEETGIQYISERAMGESKVGILRFTFADNDTEMVVHLFRIRVGFIEEEQKTPGNGSNDATSTTVLLPNRETIRGCDEITPVWFSNWFDIPLNNMFADDSLWLTTLLLQSSVHIDGWFHFRAGGQDVNTIDYYYLRVDNEDRSSKAATTPKNGTYSLRERLFHALHQKGATTLSRKEFKEAYAFLNVVHDTFFRKKQQQDIDLVIDVAGGHGALAALFLITMPSISSAVVIDPAQVGNVRQTWGEFLPSQALRFRHECLRTGLPSEIEHALQCVAPHRILVVACHACQHLSDEVLAIATSYRVKAAVMPCCQRDVSPSGSWKNTSKNLKVPFAVAMDLLLAGKYLGCDGYDVRMKMIDATITPQNRVILCRPIDVMNERNVDTARKSVDVMHSKLQRVYVKAHQQHGSARVSETKRSSWSGLLSSNVKVVVAGSVAGAVAATLLVTLVATKRCRSNLR